MSSSGSDQDSTPSEPSLREFKTSQYKGHGNMPPPGEKTYKTEDELITPPEGRLLGNSPKWYQKLYWVVRLILTVTIGWAILVGVGASYGIGLNLLADHNGRFAFGLYGACLFLHMLLQVVFSTLEHRRRKKQKATEEYTETAQSKIAIQISAYQEDPDYLRECLEGIMELKYPKDKLKVILTIDGNSEDSVYMVDIFQKTVAAYGEEPAFFWWDYNFHEVAKGLDDDSNGINALKQCVAENRCVCIMRKCNLHK